MHQGKLRTSGVFSLKIKEHELECQLDENGHPQICFKIDQDYSNYRCVGALLKAFPALLDKDYILDMAKVINFLCKGIEYQVIEEPDVYKTNYKKEIDKEQSCCNLADFSLTPYGEFDVEEISLPRIEHGKLIFYVEGKIPQRVTCEYPFKSDYPVIKYEMLPYA